MKSYAKSLWCMFRQQLSPRLQPRTFASDETGGVAILFACMIVVVLACVGTSIDYGNALSQRTNLQGSLDAAVLAAGREFQTTGDAAAAVDRAVAYFTEIAPRHLSAEVTLHSIDTQSNTILLAAKAKVPASFLRVIGYKTLEISALAKASLSGGGRETDLEVAMMLDITGSMGGQKIADLKTAAKDLVQILLPDNLAERHARISLVPFSASVNPGSYRVAVRGPDSGNPSGTGAGCPQAKSASGWLRNQCYRDTGNARQTAVRTNCVTERTGAQAFTDDGPDSVPARVNAAYETNPRNPLICPSAQIMPLSSDKDALKASIDTYSAGGWTAGQIGTAWAWYTLSPNWNGVWPGVSQPAAYGADHVMKIAVLMTDGEYNTEYANFVRAADQYGNPNSPNGRSDEQARTLCQAMKDHGITVYTVGFQLEEANAVSTLQDCATDAAHAFLANDGNELKMAFRHIAFQLAKLRLSQ